MTKEELIAEITATTKVPAHKAEAMVGAIAAEIVDAMVLEYFVYLDGLGIFWAKLENERSAQNPRTGEEMVLPAKKWPTFTSGEPSDHARKAAIKLLTNEDLSENLARKYAFEQSLAMTVIKTFVDILKRTLDSGERIVVAELGTFDSMKFPARSLKDPDTGETHSTESKRIYTFSSAKNVKERVMGIYSKG
ncbi:MAG: HU family DNA-binding protein [Candidatus Melainabacteria bacterium]|nr:HU family DNA-binding protein [Candidatus Melainabacteria bacterium]